MRAHAWLLCFTGLVTAVACGSSEGGEADSAAETNGGSSAGSSTHGGAVAGKSTAGAGTTTGGAGTSTGGAGNAGRGGAPAAGQSGAGSTQAGAPHDAEGGAPPAVGAGGENDGGSAQDGGAAGGEGGAVAAPAVAYVSTLFGELLVASLDPSSGAPTLLPSSPIKVDGTLNGVVVSPGGKYLFVPATPARIDTYPIGADGALPPQPSSSTSVEDSNGILSMALDPLGRFAYGVSPFSAAVYVFKVDAASGALTLSGAPLQLGTGPDHRAPAFVAPDPTGHFVYITQMAAGVQPDNGIRGYSVDATSGALTELGGSPFDEGDVVAGAAVFRPDGKFLFTSGNGVNAFAVDAQGELKLVVGSPFSHDVQSDAWAPNITIDPAGRLLFVTNFGATRHVTGFAIDADSGALEQAGPAVTTTSPYSLALGPGGRFLYIGEDSGQIAVFKVERPSGTLTPLAASPFAFGGLEPDLAF
ncbi:MAG TPA: beta-propeller fold lactonase family protein, partial [Polyangiaceae bacterium]|nr:beta-propeller fold lactonase family protein [Polyangiaceae bacterium]